MQKASRFLERTSELISYSMSPTCRKVLGLSLGKRTRPSPSREPARLPSRGPTTPFGRTFPGAWRVAGEALMPAVGERSDEPSESPFRPGDWATPAQTAAPRAHGRRAARAVGARARLLGQRGPGEPARGGDTGSADAMLPFALPSPTALAATLPHLNAMFDAEGGEPDEAAVRAALAPTDRPRRPPPRCSRPLRTTLRSSGRRPARADDARGGLEEPHAVRWLGRGPHGRPAAVAATLEHVIARCEQRRGDDGRRRRRTAALLAGCARGAAGDGGVAEAAADGAALRDARVDGLRRSRAHGAARAAER